MANVALPLPLDLSHFPHQVSDLVAVEVGNRGNAVNVLDEVFGCAQECLERRFAIAATEQMAVLGPSNKTEPLLSMKAEPLGLAATVGTVRRAQMAPLGARVKIAE
jgi:hypothetical protein